ncbi:PIG-L deacetylase family protein [Streptomyces antimycoticus]|uniref:PIG-L deacetylase family protein n=1 Tax=Streptomyces antimycoticus TaxID=68175 RepID=UPI00344695C1
MSHHASRTSAGLPTPARALAVGAHPDDVEYGSGGTLAKWAASGTEIHAVICTDGSKGSWDPSTDPVQLTARRQAEQRAAMKTLGGSPENVAFLGWPDGELEAGLRQRWQLAHWIRAYRPTVLLGHDPWQRYRIQTDHRHAGFLLLDALVVAMDHHYFPELALPPHRPEAVLLWEADEADHLEEVDAYLDTKIDALLEHRSQHQNSMGIPPDRQEQGTEAFRARILGRLARQAAGQDFAYAEAFKFISLTDPYEG